MTDLNRVAPESPRKPLKADDERDHRTEDDDYGEQYTYDPAFQGPVHKRKCTDILCLLLFLAFLGSWGFVGYYAYTKGDIDKIIYPTNSRGYICGRGNFTERPYLLFFDLTRCLNPAVLSIGCPTTQVCVKECPDERLTLWGASKFGFGSYDAVKTKMRPYCQMMSDSEWGKRTPTMLIDEGLCPVWVLPSSPVLGRCLPSIVSTPGGDPDHTVFTSEEVQDGQEVKEATINSAVSALGAFLSVREFGERVFNDIQQTWWMIVLGLGSACVVSFLWIVLMRFMAGVMVWTSIGLVFVAFGGLFGFSLVRYLTIKDLPGSEGNIFTVNWTPNYGYDLLSQANTWLAFTIVCGIIFFIIVLILIALRQRILIAIELIEEGSKAVAHMITTLFFPIVPFLMQLVVVLFFTAVSLYLSSATDAEYRIGYPIKVKNETTLRAGFRMEDAASPALHCPCANHANANVTYKLEDVCDPDYFEKRCSAVCDEVTCQFFRYVDAKDANWMGWFNLFGLYWGMFFASAFSELTLAGVFAYWYWTLKKKDVPRCTLGRALSNALFYHLGTVAFGSLIISVIRFVRTILSWVEKKLKMYNNDLTRCLLCACKCCLWCLEKFMRFINRNAYIMCAVKSSNFCSSAKDAFSLLMRNIVRTFVLNNVVNFLLFLGKLVVMAGIGTLAYFVFSGGIPSLNNDIPTLNYYFTPIVVIVVGTYFISSSFFGVYSMAVDTLFLCFLEDLERNDGTRERPYFMSKGLQGVVGKMQKFNDYKAD